MNYAWPGRVVPVDVLKPGNVFLIPALAQPVIAMLCDGGEICVALSPAKGLPVGMVLSIESIWQRPVLRLDTPTLIPTVNATPHIVTHGPDNAPQGSVLQHTETARMVSDFNGTRVMVNLETGVITPKPANDIGAVYTHWTLVLKMDGAPNQVLTTFGESQA